MSDTSVKVAVRVRPQLAKEIIDMCQICTSVTPGEPQVVLGKDKAFTFDYVFDMDSGQPEIYAKCAHELIEGTFEGYNATVFAYGQTGSGKTYTMGTGFDVHVDVEQVGIIPRAVKHLFDGIERRRCRALDEGRLPPDFKVNAQFIELYNEELLDLLDTTRDPSVKGHKSHIRVHEDANGSIYTVGITTKPVNSLSDTMQCLKTGALIRTTGSTNMNAQSSRSHAIFTLLIRQQRVVELATEESEAKNTVTTDFEVLTAKFHFVDLAGSERLKRTGATGHRAKEGISINCGLLALGNVISALGDQTKKASHIPYRDSKLTRLLQDSLGGNSRTVMITCISPSDRDFMETLNALKYANRARNIKNRVMVNQDKTSQQMAELRLKLQALQSELMEYKMGKRVDDMMVTQSDVSAENMLLQTENNNLRLRIKALQNSVDCLSARNAQLSAEIDSRTLSSFQDNVNEETKKLMETYRRIIEDQKARIDELEATKNSMGPYGSLLLSSSSCHPSVSNSALATTPTFVMDFNIAPDEHMQETLKAARRDLKRLRSKVCVKEGKAVYNNNAADGGDKDTSCAVEEKDEMDEDNNGNMSSDDSAGSDEITAGAGGGAAADDTENGNDGDLLHDDLEAVSNRISIQEKLISELELSKKRAEAMRMHYEEKLLSLSHKIVETEVERDKVLATLGTAESHNQEVVSRVREDYEKKLVEMQAELRKLESAKLEHAKIMKNQAQYEIKCRELQQNLLGLKKQKVQLEIKIREETQKIRQKELEYTREMNQLRREQKQKDSTIRTLEAEKRQREVILRQKLEEVRNV